MEDELPTGPMLIGLLGVVQRLTLKKGGREQLCFHMGRGVARVELVVCSIVWLRDQFSTP